MQKFKIIGKPLLGEKYVEGKKKEGIMPSLVATTSALSRTTCMRMRSVRTNFLLKERQIIRRPLEHSTYFFSCTDGPLLIICLSLYKFVAPSHHPQPSIID